jgi:3-methyl-2-oxobutanoate hydroxymethyltransferase
MSRQTETARRLTAPDIRARKGAEPIVCLTAYTTPVAQILDPHCDLLLVGDSVGMVVHGLPNTVGVTLEMMIMHGQAVMRGSQHAMVVVDMPFGAYEAGPEQAFTNATRILKETGAQAVKVEAGTYIADTIAFLVQRGIPVMGHVGLTPQAFNTIGGFKVQGRDPHAAETIRADAEAVAAAGAFAVVVEAVVEPLARDITGLVPVPTIGIGASPACDGQILVLEDMLGLSATVPKFVRRFGNLASEIRRAVNGYAEAVRDRSFPAEENVYLPRPNPLLPKD